MYATLPCSHLLHVAAIVIERAPVIIEWPRLSPGVVAAPSKREGREGHAGHPSPVDCGLGPVSPSDLMSCWSAMHDRQRAWSRRVVMTEAPIMADDPELSRFVVEVFLSEPLSRLWSAVVACQQQRQGLNAMASIYRTTLEREDELRRRAVGAVLAGRSMSLETSLQLHRMRRYSHRATQLLIESLASRYATAESFRIDSPTSPMHRERPQLHWWSAATQAAAPLRLLAQCLATGSISGDAQCSAETMQVVQCVLKCLPPVTLDGSDIQMGPAQLAAHSDGESAQRLLWGQAEPRSTPSIDVAARRR